jgi:hypothetical protein
MTAEARDGLDKKKSAVDRSLDGFSNPPQFFPFCPQKQESRSRRILHRIGGLAREV